MHFIKMKIVFIENKDKSVSGKSVCELCSPIWFSPITNGLFMLTDCATPPNVDEFVVKTSWLQTRWHHGFWVVLSRYSACGMSKVMLLLFIMSVAFEYLTKQWLFFTHSYSAPFPFDTSNSLCSFLIQYIAHYYPTVLSDI